MAANASTAMSSYNQSAPRKPGVPECLLLDLWEIATPREFVRCLGVCKDWNHWGQVILHKVVILNNRNLARFIDCAQHRPERFSSVKSLTVRLGIRDSYLHESIVGAGRRTKEQLLRSLADIMNQHMSGLQAFSLKIEDEPIGPTEFGDITVEPRIGAESLISLLRVIPVSCTSLEFDTAGYEAYMDDDHFCPHIASLMSTLRHLRLRLGRICPEFINAPPYDICGDCPEHRQTSAAPNLRSLVVNMELSELVVGGTTRCSLGQPVDSSFRLSEDDPTDRLQSEITLSLKAAKYEKSCFPSADTIGVFGPTRMDVAPYHHIRHTDIMKIQTHILTSTTLGALVGGGIWKRGAKRCIRTAQKEDIIGTKTTSREELEGAWLTTTKGGRLPKAAASNEYFLGGTPLTVLWQTLPRESLRDYIRRNTRDTRGPATTPHPVQAELLRLKGSDNIAQTYRTLRPIRQSEFPHPYPMV
ncbi:hypothetical protein FQN54_005317 [Arachnomyces sp. PD_36]|nr:hypothetical protein FQN54_005317 [Arachnomyces sp. PD_36]